MTDKEESAKVAIPQKFLVAGLVTSEDFQKCRYAVLKLHRSFPKEFQCPDIRPMLDVEWNEFILKYQRKIGNGLWSIKNRVAVFKNGEFLGDFSDLNEFIWQKWKFVFNENWYELACRHLVEYLEEKTENYRQLVYLTIAVNNSVIGSLLFELYNDIVPLASENFLNRCKDVLGSYSGAPIHRIVKNSWIQCGGYELDPIKMPCENYVVPHNRRGVLSTCNNGPNKNNSTQFFVSLESTPWMNYKYVAFGQLLQGDNVLKTIEDIPTYYQAPIYDIKIVKCGEFKTRIQSPASCEDLCAPQEFNQWKEIQKQMDILTYLKTYHQVIGPEGHHLTYLWEPPQFTKSADSIWSQQKLKRGVYSLPSDRKTYGPFRHLPDFGDDLDEAIENDNICEPFYPLKIYSQKLYSDSLTPNSSDVTL